MANKRYSRRDFIKIASVATLSGFGLSGVSCKKADLEEFLQKHYLEMTEEEKKQTIARLEEKYLEKYGKKFTISTRAAKPGTLWGYGLDLSRCIGCRRCVYACVKASQEYGFLFRR